MSVVLPVTVVAGKASKSVVPYGESKALNSSEHSSYYLLVLGPATEEIFPESIRFGRFVVPFTLS